MQCFEYFASLMAYSTKSQNYIWWTWIILKPHATWLKTQFINWKIEKLHENQEEIEFVRWTAKRKRKCTFLWFKINWGQMHSEPSLFFYFLFDKRSTLKCGVSSDAHIYYNIFTVNIGTNTIRSAASYAFQYHSRKDFFFILLLKPNEIVFSKKSFENHLKWFQCIQNRLQVSKKQSLCWHFWNAWKITCVYWKIKKSMFWQRQKNMRFRECTCNNRIQWLKLYESNPIWWWKFD